MKKILKAIGRGVSRLGTAAVTLYRRYPSRGNSYILSAVVAAGAAVGVALNPQSVGTIVALVVPILLGGEATHHLVSPAK